jgi:hypothetical protein
MGRSSGVTLSAVAPHAGALAAPFQPLPAPLEALATMLQAVPPMLQALALSLPLSPAVLVPAALQPLAVALPSSSLPLHPIPMPLQPLSPALKAPAIMPTMALVTGMPSLRMPLGPLDGKGVGWADLGGQGRPREAQRGSEGERRVKTCHAFPPAAVPRGSKWSGLARTGG